jgi:hypothetical protein
MEISHVSAAVREPEPERAARALAGIWGGSAHPFFPLPGAWIAFSPEEPWSQVEFNQPSATWTDATNGCCAGSPIASWLPLPRTIMRWRQSRHG